MLAAQFRLSGMLLKRGTGNGERGTGNGERGTGNGERGTGNGERGAGSGERGTEVWERVVSGNLHKNPKWPSKKRERERRRQRKEFVPWLKSGGGEIANQTHILRLRFEQVVCFFDIQPVSFLSFRDTWHTHIPPGLLRLL